MWAAECSNYWRGTYLLEVAALALLALRLCRRLRLNSSSWWLWLRSHLLKEAPVLGLGWQGGRDVLFLAGLGCRRLRGAFFPLLILSLLCLPTYLWAAACLVLVLSAPPSVAASVASTFGFATFRGGSSTCWISSILLSSVRTTRLLHCYVMYRSDLLKL